MDEDAIRKLREYGFKLLSIRVRSEKEFREKISQFATKRKIISSIIDQVLLYFKDHNFINDHDFALWWTDQRRRTTPRGDRFITMELKEKGIDSDIIKEVLQEKQEGESEEDRAWKLVHPKIKILSKLPEKKMKEKIIGMLLRRGFDWDTIHRIIDSLTQKSYNKR